MKEISVAILLLVELILSPKEPALKIGKTG